MKKLRIPIVLGTLYLFVYTIGFELNFPAGLTYLLFAPSPLVVIGLVIWVIWKGKPTDRTWEEGYFYEDAQYRHKEKEADQRQPLHP